MYKKVLNGPTVFFDCDDTLVMWNIPDNCRRTVEITCRGFTKKIAPNDHNIDLLKNMAARGHEIVVWSGGGSDWAESVVLALKLEDYVSVVTSKPTYYIDDVSDTKNWMGKHGFFDYEGNRDGTVHLTEK